MTLEQPTDEDRQQASPQNLEKMWKFVTKFAEKSGSDPPPPPAATPGVPGTRPPPPHR